ncbi:hypothetical protein [Thiocapsa roseopersicina]|uniref:Uncharacterized protein n=1 Tax=Thiocapsa roseopersicina TaxID=1058 RepID=A0A1H3CQS8_THIRO|nr:hypothetical protein [Thiocapsa roseopersicina]SDX55779.1 hypothetical protein SAMN05421783_13614 [Thiocapsa roseopersicina]
MITATMNSFDRADRGAAARIAALMPVMEERYRRLQGTLSRACAGEDIPDWELDLHRADLLAALEVMSPGADESGEEAQ